MPERFLSLAELYERKAGEAAVLQLVSHLPTAAEQQAAVRQMIAWAEERLIAYTPQYRNRLPSSPAETPATVKDLLADLARWRLEVTYTEIATPSVVEIGQRALRDLDDLRAGRRQLSLPAVKVDDKRPTVAVLSRDADPHFDHAGAAKGLKL